MVTAATMASTATDAKIAIHAGPGGGGTAITELAGTEPWRPRILAAVGGMARVALVQSRASLLAGDRVALTVDVEPGCALEIIELGATVAHHARGGAGASVAVRVRVGRGASARLAGRAPDRRGRVRRSALHPGRARRRGGGAHRGGARPRTGR